MKCVAKIPFASFDIAYADVRFGKLRPVANLTIVFERRCVVIARDTKLGKDAIGTAHAKITFADQSVVARLPSYLKRLIKEGNRSRDLVVEAMHTSQTCED